MGSQTRPFTPVHSRRSAESGSRPASSPSIPGTTSVAVRKESLGAARFRSRVSDFLRVHHAVLRAVALGVYACLIVGTTSYGITQSTAINSYGIQPGTPLIIQVMIVPAASVFYLAQFITYGSVHVCGTFSSPCAWPKTWPGPRPLQNVSTFDDIWFTLFALSFVTFLFASRSFFRALRAVSVAPIILGIILFFDDNHWFYIGFSNELNMMGYGWLTNETLMFIGVGCFITSTLCLRFRRRGPGLTPEVGAPVDPVGAGSGQQPGAM